MTVFNTVVTKLGYRADQLYLPTWVRPDVRHYYPTYQLIRDCIEGEEAIKGESTAYLPKVESQTQEDYQAFLERAVFFNFTAKTISALVGTLFKHPPQLEGIPASQTDKLKTVSIDGMGVDTYLRHLTHEITAMGRVGLLVDMPSDPTTDPTPYMTTYTAEHILDWTYDTYKGKKRLREVVLREPWMPSREASLVGVGSAAVGSNNALPDVGGGNYTSGPGSYIIDTAGGPLRRYWAAYRRLSLDYLPDPDVPGVNRWTYTQTVYKRPQGDATLLDGDALGTVVPLVKGVPLDYIPFMAFGVDKNTLDVAKPEMGDIARLNIAHYKSYAILEQGRWFCGTPIYHVEVQGESAGEYRLGANMVWETPIGTKPGILEFNGGGLKSLENSLLQKEAQAASLGGRMIGLTASSTAESTDVARMKHANEHALLLSIASSLESGFAEALGWWSSWQVPLTAPIELRISRSFLVDSAGAREFRAIQSMYSAGVIPVEVLHSYLTQYDVVPSNMSLQEFIGLLSDTSSFPSQPDAMARKAGFPNRASQLASEATDQAHKIALKDAESKRLVAEAKSAQGDVFQQNADSLQTLNDAQAELFLAQAAAASSQEALTAAQAKVDAARPPSQKSTGTPPLAKKTKN